MELSHSNLLTPRVRMHLLIAGLCVGGAIILFLTHLTYNGLWIDEVYTLHAVHLPWPQMVLERLKRGHFPLYFGLMKLWLGWLGRATETTLRIPSVLFWLGAVGSYWSLARRILGLRGAAIGLTLFALNGLALRQAIEARMYDLVLLESVWVALAYLTLLSTAPRRKWPLVFVVLSLVGFFTSSSFAFILAVLSYDAYSRRKHQPYLFRTILLVWGMLLVASIPPAYLHVSLRDRGEVAHVRPATLALHLNTFLSGVVGADDYYAISGWLVAMVLGGGLISTILLIRLWHRHRDLPPVMQVCTRATLLPIGAMVITWIVEEATGLRVAVHGPARYLIAILPFSTLLVAWLLEREFATRPVRLLYAHSFFAALLLLDGVGVMRLRVESARELLRIKLNQMYQPGDAVVVVPDQAAEVVELYAPNVRIDLALDRALTDETAIREQLVRFHDRERVFLVWLHGKQSPAVRVADELFGEGISSSPRARLGERRIFVYYPKQGPIQRQPPHEAP